MSGKQIGYIRVSTVDQNTARQLDGLSLDKVFEDKASGKSTTDRPGLDALLDYIREGDQVHVHDISRLARNLKDLHDLVNQITGKGCLVRFEKEGLTFGDTSNPCNELMLSVIGAIYQFERSMLLERQREGIALAKSEGKYQGGKKRIDRDAVIAALQAGSSVRKTAKDFGVAASSVQRIKAEMTAKS